MTEVRHATSVGNSYSGTGPGQDSASYSNRFSAIPHSTPYRPARITPKPLVQGAQTAAVAGKKSEEIWVDKYGRVKVQFRWDRQGNAEFSKEPRENPEMPVTNIDFNQAREFCEGVGKKLPTAQEWEKAARGTDGRLYPWGNQENPRLASVVNVPAVKPHRLLRADTALGAGPYGALNMTGNAWEYVDEPRTPVPDSLEIFRPKVGPSCSLQGPWFKVRGASYERPLAPDGRTFEWMEVPACYRAQDYGFRCVKIP